MNRPLPSLTPELERRFFAKVTKSPGCWTWTGARQARGYGSMGMGPRGDCHSYLAHRLAHHWWVGPIADGLQVDHKCHNVDPSCPGGVRCVHRLCVNPAHLEAVTAERNGMRAAARLDDRVATYLAWLEQREAS